ncbi:MAG: phosphotransferase [Alphaproteobacteria bacterium]|nr:phosphotransferase [Alphaproteobacteria bacterium]
MDEDLKRSLKVVILENEQNTVQILRRILPKLFLSLNYKAICVDTKDATQVDELIREDRCDVLFCDLTLGSAKVGTGLDHIRRIKSEFPHVFVVACSQESPKLQEVNDRAPHTFDIFLPKESFIYDVEKSNARVGWQEQFRSDFVEKFRIATDIDLEIPEEHRKATRINHPDPAHRGASLEWSDIRTLCRQCLWTGPKLDAQFLPNVARLIPLGGGRSGSLVMRIELSVRDRNLDFVPLVLKISPLDRAREEMANFQRYVRLIVPYRWRVDTVGWGETRLWGAIAYSFAFGDAAKYVSLTDFISKGDQAAFENLADQIFGRSGHIWYNQKFESVTPSLSTHYIKKFFSPDYRLNSARTGLTSFLTNCGIHEHDGFEIGGTEYPAPWRLLFERLAMAGTMTVCHGDLNSNNIIVTSDAKQITFIDFQDTGRGHVFEDFVALESSVRLYYPSEATKLSPVTLRQHIDAESVLLDSFPEGGKLNRQRQSLVPYAGFILKVRERANAIFGKVNPAEYLYALAAFHYRLARIADLTDAQRMRTSACMFAALHRLART